MPRSRPASTSRRVAGLSRTRGWSTPYCGGWAAGVAGREVLDRCAAPGGKPAQLAPAGARVTAVDRSTRRLDRLVANLQRLDLPVEAVGADALTWRPPHPAEAVLLDAPCSTTGAIRRHPDVPHLKSPEDVARLSVVQERFLQAAIDMLRRGGTLVYCT